jgi:hypothetical protein
MPLPNSGIFHPRWSSHHRQTVETALTSTCLITRAGEGEGTSGPDGSWTPPDRTPVYRGPCRVAAKGTVAGGAEHRLVVGERQQTERDYLIQILDSAPEIQVGDIAEITGNPADPAMTGLAFRISDVQYGSQSWLRDLISNEVLRGQ